MDAEYKARPSECLSVNQDFEDVLAGMQLSDGVPPEAIAVLRRVEPTLLRVLQEYSAYPSFAWKLF